MLLSLFLLVFFRWVHIVCALYIPGVAFGDVEKLRWITLSEMNPTKWGARVGKSSLIGEIMK